MPCPTAGGLDETREILRFLAKEVSPDTFVNIMPQYRPEGLASRFPAIIRPLMNDEFQAAVAIARESSESASGGAGRNEVRHPQSRCQQSQASQNRRSG